MVSSTHGINGNVLPATARRASHSINSLLLRCLLVTVLASALAAFNPGDGRLLAADPQALLANGEFSEWKDGAPEGWSIEIGARNGKGDESTATQGVEGGLTLEGDDSTAAWKAVKQTVPLAAESFYRLRYEARTAGVRKAARQYDNCFVGVFVKDARGQRTALHADTIESSDWTAGSLSFSSGPDAASADVTVFLSKTGRLDVRNLVLEQLRAEDSFRILAEDMDQHYSFFEAKQIDWQTLTDEYRARAERAASAAEFVNAIKPMLGELRDPHVTITAPGGQPVATYARRYESNFDFQYVAKRLNSREQIGRIGFVGRGDGGFGYIAVGSLGGDERTFQQLEDAFVKLLDAPGLIVDLRANNGGAELRALRLVGLLTDQPRVYAKSKFRSGSAHDAFSEIHERVLQPRNADAAYLRPIVCLIGPGCISSGEGMALMLKSLPHATLIGQPTAGASGNPAPLALPNGVTVSYSRWQSLTPDEQLIEGAGVTPAVVIEHKRGRDPTFDAAVKLLQRKARQSAQ